MMTFFRALALSLALLLATGAAHAQPSASIVASDLLKIEQLGDVQISSDGRHIAYTVRSMVETPGAERPYAYRTHIHYVPGDGREAPRPLTRGDQSARQPAWHPDGDRLAFVRTVDGTPQIFVLSLSGGEPYQLTDHEHGASNPRWSPRGNRTPLFRALPGPAVHAALGRGPRWPDERPGRAPGDTTITVPPDTLVVLRDSLTRAPLDTLAASAPAARLALLADSLAAFPDTVTIPGTIAQPTAASPDGSLLQVRKWLDQRRDENDPRVFNRLDFHAEQSLRSGTAYRHLFVMDVDEDGAASAPRAITTGFYDAGGGTWLPGGDQVVLHAAIDTTQHPDRVRDRNLYIADADSQNVQPLLQLDRYAIYNPRVTPDGTTLAFSARDLRDPAYAQTEIGLFPLDGRSAPELITTGFDRSPGQVRWSPNGWYLYFTAASEGGFPLYRTAPFAADSTRPPMPQREISGTAFTIDDALKRPRPVERLTAPDRGVRSFDVTVASAYYVVTEASNPYELYTNTADFTGERRLSRHNARWLAGKRLSTPEPFTARSDSFQVDGWVMRPTPFADSLRYPVLVEMHGGPSAMWGPGEATMWHEFQWMAARGYAVVYANPRGSGGYGRAFKAANYQDWGTGPMRDVLAAVDTALATNAWMDGTRQVLTGGSYAGYLTAWMVSQTDRFEAAVAQRGVYDLPTFLGEGNAWRLVPYHFGGYPWEGATPPPIGVPDSVWTASIPADTSARAPQQILRRNSPMTYVHRIRTPLLIMHADRDFRTGVSQSEMLYRALKVMERPVEYVRYPNAGHDLSRSGAPQQRIDRLLRIHEFMARFTEEGAPRPRQPASSEQ